jgi:hypothetical protein
MVHTILSKQQQAAAPTWQYIKKKIKSQKKITKIRKICEFQYCEQL